MRLNDFVQFSFSAVSARRLRSGLSALGIAMGIAAVVLLTSMGEGLHRYMISEFSQFGTNLIAINPGKTSTLGFSGALVNTVRPLSLDDAVALKRLPQVIEAVPLVQGNAQVEAGERQRRTVVYGVGPGVPAVWQFKTAYGRFLPDDDAESARAFVVLGSKMRDELFSDRQPLGELVRVGSYRFRVIGVMATEGRSIGMDVQNIAIIPVASAQSLLNTPSLLRILIETKSRKSMFRVKDFVEQTLQQRHHGELDVTVVTQDAVIKTFDDILNSLTYSVAGIAAISLLVAGILIMNVMLVVVSQRTAEIGLLKALGASRSKILTLILTEALQLSFIGVVLGFMLGLGGSWAMRLALPELQAYPPIWAMLSSVLVALGTGLLFSLLPARKAAALDPVQALQGH